ncbi:MAG: hypothetical protein JNN13_08195 [Planctomycetes bacterium]|nr:hypothetical protein [Planctomycetota bacterium]
MRGTVLLAATLLGACAASPAPGEPELQRAAGRIAAIDVGLQSAARRLANLSHRLAAAPDELARFGRLAAPGDCWRAAWRGTATMPDRLAALAGAELSRRPEPPAGLWREPHEYVRAVAEGVVATATLLQGSAHPLDDIDDQHHRTSPQDDRPEAAWLDRIRRRLRL